jgi:hypothetical protein
VTLMSIALQPAIARRAKREAGNSTRSFIPGFPVHACGVKRNDE